MNLWTATNGAKTLAALGNRKSAKVLLRWAEEILDRYRKEKAQGAPDPPAICCFSVENGVIACDKIVIRPDGSSENLGKLFPGTREERIELCRQCRTSSEKEIKQLKKQLFLKKRQKPP